MLGMVFTEFLEMVEQRWSPALAEQLLTDVAPASGGHYTAVGYYPTEELVGLVDALTVHSQLPASTLIHAFGEFLFGRFLQLHPTLFAKGSDCFSLLASVDNHIHREVRKLYPEAELPTFCVREHSPQRLLLEYHSVRPLADLAEGLIRACVAHYREPVQLRRTDLSPPHGQAGALFELSRAS